VSLPPLLARYLAWFDTSPVLAVLVGLGVLILAFLLLRMALKVFLFFVILLVIAIVGSYFYLGAEQTEEALRQGVEEAQEKIYDDEAETDHP
jgi:membrane protein implicated in regulation of membrane protease activity